MTLIALEYHDVVAGGDVDASGFPGEAAASYKLDAARFEDHLDAVAASGARVVVSGVDAPVAAARGRQAMLTFDDGGASALAVIAPALERRGWRGHFFIATDYIGKAGFLSGAELRALGQRGHVVGSHSRTHPLRMASLSDAALADEWRTSVQLLGEILGALPPIASVPGGALSNAVIDAAVAAGVRVLFTSEPTTRIVRRGDCAVVGRYTLRRAHAGNVAAALLGDAGSARAAQWLAWNGKKLAKRLGGDAYLRAREAMFNRR